MHPTHRIRSSLLLALSAVIFLGAAPAAEAQLAVAVGGGGATLIDTATNEVVRTAPYAVGSCAIRDSRQTVVLLDGFNNQLVELDLRSLRERRTIPLNVVHGYRGVVVDSRSDHALVPRIGGLTVVDLKRGAIVHDSTVSTYAVAQSGRRVLSVGPNEVKLLNWRPRSRGQILTDSGYALPLYGLGIDVEFAPDGRTAIFVDRAGYPASPTRVPGPTLSQQIVSVKAARMKRRDALTPRGVAGVIMDVAFHESGKIVFAYTHRGEVYAYAYDPARGRFGRLLWRTNARLPFPVGYGADPLMPVGDRLYVLEGTSHGIEILDAWTGARVERMRDRRLSPLRFGTELCGPAS